MPEARVNDARAKRLRARLRREQRPCHVCGQPIDYTAHHHDPLAFEMDHLWQVDLGGPLYEWDNLGSSHRACNRRRSNKIDQTTIAAALQYGVILNLDTKPASHAPNGIHCTECNGTHNPTAGVTYVTARNWWSTPARR